MLDGLEILTHDGLRRRVGATGEEELEAIIAAGELAAPIRGLTPSPQSR